MPEEVPPASGQATENATDPGVTEAPADFREYVKWRETGELPEAKDQPPSAAAETPPAKTEPDSEPEDSQEPDEADDQAPQHEETERQKRMGSRQRRIDRLTKENEEFKRENEELRRVAAQAVKPAEQPPPAPPAPAGKPKLEDFETLEAYQEALTFWALDQREAARKQEAERATAEKTRQEEQTSWTQKERTARKAHADFDDVMDNITVRNTNGFLAARQALLESDAGAEILYYLGKNPKELERIAGLSPVGAVVEIGRLSVRFSESAAPDNGKPKVTGAPKPPPPTGRPGKTSSDDIDDPEVQRDFRKWMRAREAQLRK